MHIPLGTPVYFTAAYTYRTTVPGEVSKYPWRYWVRVEADKPLCGVVTGVRTLSNGNVIWEPWEDGGTDYRAKEFLRVYLVATSPKENPMRVPQDAIFARMDHAAALEQMLKEVEADHAV